MGSAEAAFGCKSAKSPATPPALSRRLAAGSPSSAMSPPTSFASSAQSCSTSGHPLKSNACKWRNPNRPTTTAHNPPPPTLPPPLQTLEPAVRDLLKSAWRNSQRVRSIVSRCVSSLAALARASHTIRAVVGAKPCLAQSGGSTSTYVCAKRKSMPTPNPLDSSLLPHDVRYVLPTN